MGRQESVLESVRRTGKVADRPRRLHSPPVLAQRSLAVIASQAFTDLDAPLQRLAMPDVPIPYNLALMEAVVPSLEAIRAEMERLLAY